MLLPLIILFYAIQTILFGLATYDCWKLARMRHTLTSGWYCLSGMFLVFALSRGLLVFTYQLSTTLPFWVILLTGIIVPTTAGIFGALGCRLKRGIEQSRATILEG